MSILDEINWGLLIIWVILMVSVFIKMRRATHRYPFFSLYASNMGMGMYFILLMVARHHWNVSVWWDTLGVAIGIGCQGYWLWRIWRESNKEPKKAISS